MKRKSAPEVLSRLYDVKEAALAFRVDPVAVAHAVLADIGPLRLEGDLRHKAEQSRQYIMKACMAARRYAGREALVRLDWVWKAPEKGERQ